MNLAQTLTPNKDSRQLYFLRSNGLQIEILRDDKHIWLLVNEVVQSAIELKPPYRPILPHCLVMLLPLIHLREPRSILELGGGGLSFQRYLAHAHPGIAFTSVECNQDIIAAVQSNFPQSESLKVAHSDAFEYLRRCVKQQETFDWLIVDLFQGAQSPLENETEAYLPQLFDAVESEGWLILNCLNPDKAWLQSLCRMIEELVGAPPYLFAVPQMQNHIVFVHNGPGAQFPEQVVQFNLYV